MQNSNIHDYLSNLQENYSEIIKCSREESTLLEGIFSELLNKPDLTEEEKNLVDHLCEDVGNLHFYWDEKLTLAFQRYQQQTLKTHSQGVSLLTNTPPPPDFSLMSNEDILKHFNLDKSIKKESARDILCNYIKNLTNPNLPPSPLNFSDLEVKMLPKCFLTDPFFSDMQVNISGKIPLPPDIKISEIRNLNVYTQVISHRMPPFEQFCALEDPFKMSLDYLNLSELAHVQSVSKSSKMDPDYKYFRESILLLTRAGRVDTNPDASAVDQKTWNELADEVHKENLSFLTHLEKAGHIDPKLDINALPRLECQKIAQQFHDESLIQSFPRILKALPLAIRRSWQGGDPENVSEIRNFLHANKASLSMVTLNLTNIPLKCIPPEIKFFTALRNLFLEDNQISDLTPLATLPALTYLSLFENKISDLTPLATLTALIHLDLHENQISDLTPLATLTALINLDLHENKISDLSPLATLTALINLDLHENKISDLSPLATLTALINLNLSDNQISDLTPLATLTTLRDLNLFLNQISNLQTLATLTALINLNLSDNQISDLSPLATLTALIHLDLRKNEISNLTLPPLATLTTLIYLNLNENKISDLSHLEHLTDLRDLSLSNNLISDLSHLEHLTALKSLSLSNNLISDLSHFLEQNHPNLKMLFILDQRIIIQKSAFILAIKTRFPEAIIW